MRVQWGGLWRHRDFMLLWTGETISHMGSQVTGLALPLAAAMVLQATPLQMGVLQAIGFAPFLLIALFAGVWVDRLPRRPVLIAGDVGRALFLAVIPAAAVLGWLRMEVLYAVALGTGVLTVFFDVAYQAYLPALVHRDQLVEGNAKLEVSRAGAQIAGPGVAGVLIQFLGAPLAILLDSASFLLSGACIGLIRAAEPPVERRDRGEGMWRQIGQGLRVVLGNPLLRNIAACTGTSNLFGNVVGAVMVLFLTRELGLSPGQMGVMFAAGNVGFLLGALAAAPLSRRLGLGRAIGLMSLLSGAGLLVLPLAGGPVWAVMALLMGAQFLGAVAAPAYNINQVSLRQAITPQHLQGRMNATMRFIVWGTIPLGALLGGGLGSAIGLRPTLWVGAAGSLLAFLWIRLSPVWPLREIPAAVPDDRAAGQ